MSAYQLFEWSSLTLGEGGLSARDAESLVHAAQAPAARLKGAQRAFDLGRDSLSARNLVGVVAGGSAICEILPKVDRDVTGDAPLLRRQLIRMLGVAHDLPIADDVATTLETQSDTLLEILISRFVTLLEETVGRGMPRAYVAHEEELPSLRGRLDVMRQFTTLAASPHMLACRYDEFSADIALNQVMKAAIARLRRLSRREANLRTLGELSLLYADVSSVPATSLAWQSIVPDRSNMRWLTLVRMAKLILGNRFQNSAHGTADGFALLFDMNALFERYVEKLLSPIAEARGWRIKAQSGAVSCLHPEDGAKSLFDTFPDLQLCREGRTDLVVDTKWKCLVDRRRDPKMNVAQADVYQLMAYAQLYRCNQLVLLYPNHAGLHSPLPVHHRVASQDGDVRLSIAAIDLSSQAAASACLALLLDELPANRSGSEELVA